MLKTYRVTFDYLGNCIIEAFKSGKKVYILLPMIMISMAPVTYWMYLAIYALNENIEGK